MPFASRVPHKGLSGIVGTPKDDPDRRMEKRVAGDNFRYPLATRQPTVLKRVLLSLLLHRAAMFLHLLHLTSTHALILNHTFTSTFIKTLKLVKNVL
jgi:hypothetical protein